MSVLLPAREQLQIFQITWLVQIRKLQRMKLIRFRCNGKVNPGVAIEHQYYDASTFGEDYNEGFFDSDGLVRLKNFLNEKGKMLPQLPDDIELSSPVARPSKIVCIGLNYIDHAKEAKLSLPAEPIIFLKSTTALCGPNDTVIIPKGSVKTDWEVELAVVISKKASYIDESEALNYVAGYSLMNDVSERSFQFDRSGTWDKGKGCDTFGPMGPFLATPDEIVNVNQMRLWLKINDKIMQDGNTADLIFKIPRLISYVSQFMTLLPGDVISTGTPAGVGMGMQPQVFLKDGDIMEMGSDCLGICRQTVKMLAL